MKKQTELDCDEDDICVIQMNFQLNEESVLLSPGESYNSAGAEIESISLVTSTDLKEQTVKVINGIKSFRPPNGTERLVTYILKFDSSAQISSNIFQKIWSWLSARLNWNKDSRSAQKVQTPLPFETLSQQFHSGHGEKHDYVVKDAETWKSLWEKVYATQSPTPELPQIDFDTQMVIAVFQGTFGSGGYKIEVTEITEKAKSIEVAVKETIREHGSVATAALTQPYHIVVTDRVDKEVVFVH